MVVAQSRHEDQWNRIEDPDMKRNNYNHLIFDKGIRIYDGASSTKTAGKTG
jgi:hypothetical protein